VRAAFLLPFLLLGCRSSTTSESVGPRSPVVTRTTPVRAWEMWQQGRCLGSLVRFEDPGDTSRGYYSVRAREGHEIGLVDLEGRAWRYRAHQSEPEWLGTGTVLDGVRRILGGTQSAELVEVDLAQLKDVLERLR